MSKVHSGLILMGVGIVLNLLGRLIIPYTRITPNVVMAAIMLVWMVASVVLVLFGLFRLLVGLGSKDRSAPPT